MHFINRRQFNIMGEEVSGGGGGLLLNKLGFWDIRRRAVGGDLKARG